jgi:hypothetical protein
MVNVMCKFGLVATGSDSWKLLRAPANSHAIEALSAAARASSSSTSAELAIAKLRKTAAHPDLWFFQSAGEPHMIPIIAEDYYVACRKYLMQIEEREIEREDLTLF